MNNITNVLKGNLEESAQEKSNLEVLSIQRRNFESTKTDPSWKLHKFLSQELNCGPTMTIVWLMIYILLTLTELSDATGADPCRAKRATHHGPTRVTPSSFLMFLDHTQRRTAVGRIPLDEWSARRRDLYLTTHNTLNRQTSMPPVGFKPTISAGERPQTYALDGAVTGTGKTYI